MLLLLMGSAWAGWEPPARLMDTYNRGLAALDAAQPDEAEVAFRRILQADPSCGAAQHGLGVALLRQNQPDEAVAIMEQVALNWPEQEAALTGLAWAAFAAQDFDQARGAARQAVELAPGSTDALAALVTVLLRQGDVQTAQGAIQAARGDVPAPDLSCLEAQVRSERGDSAGALALLPSCRQSTYRELVLAVEGLFSSDVSLATAAAAEVTSSPGLELLAEALQRFQAQDYANAAALLDAVLAEMPERIDARVLRARARHKLGNIPGAREDLEAAFQGDTWVTAHRNGLFSGVMLHSQARDVQRLIIDAAALQVDILVEAGDLPAARGWLARARGELGAQPELAAAEAGLLRAGGQDPWPVLADGLQRWPTSPALLDKAGKWGTQEPARLPESAIEALSRSTRWEDRYNLAGALLGRGDAARCLAEARAAAAEGGPARSSAARQQLWTLGYRCAVQAEDLAAADDLLAKLSQQASLPAVARVNHARMRYYAGQPDPALALLDAGPLDPGVLPLAASLRTRIYAESERWREAVASAGPAPAPERYWLGQKLAESGHLSEAAAVLGGACPQLAGSERTECSQLLVRLGGG